MRPNPADVTYVATWRGSVYVALLLDVFSRRLAGWLAHPTMRTHLVLEAPDSVLYDRELDGRLVVHSDRGSQYVAMCSMSRLADGSVRLAQSPGAD